MTTNSRKVVSLILLTIFMMMIPITQVSAGAADGYSSLDGLSLPDGFSANFDSRSIMGSKTGAQTSARITAEGFSMGTANSQVIDGELEIPAIFDVESITINASGGTMSHSVVPRSYNDRGNPSDQLDWTWLSVAPGATHDGNWMFNNAQWDWNNTGSQQYSGYWNLTPSYQIANPNILRFAYMAKENTNILLQGNQLNITINLKLNQDINTTTTVFPQLLRFGMFNNYTQDDRFDLDFTSKNELLISAEQDSLIDYTFRKLFTGDDTDLIPSNKTAYAFEFYGLDQTSKILFDGMELIYSEELSVVRGKPNYVLVYDSANENDLFNTSKLVIDTVKTQNTIKFADTDDNNIVNAQDALNTLSTWLRKLPAPNDKQMVSMNVTADGALDTRDSLTIIQMYTKSLQAPISHK